MASLSALRNGLKTNLQTIAGLKVFDRVPDNVSELPCAVVGPPQGNNQNFIDYSVNFGPLGAVWTLAVHLYVVRVDAQYAQSALDAYLDDGGALSLRQAIESDRTLNGSCDSVNVQAARGYGLYDVGGVQFLGCEIEVQILTST